MSEAIARTQTLTRDEWYTRYKQRFIDVAGITPTLADAAAAAESFEVLSDGYEDDPEGAADSEMSYWEAD